MATDTWKGPGLGGGRGSNSQTQQPHSNTHEWESEGGEERVRRLSGMEAVAGCVLSERHPVAAGLFNTSVFVIIPHKQRGECLGFALTT